MAVEGRYINTSIQYNTIVGPYDIALGLSSNGCWFESVEAATE